MSAITDIQQAIARAKRIGKKEPGLYSIAGNIVDGAAAALPLVAVTAYKNSVLLATTATDAAGDFAFPAGFESSTTYDIYAVLTGYTADNDPLIQAVAAANVTDADFVLTAEA